MSGFGDRLTANEQIAALLIDSVVDYAIFVLDPDGVVRTWNAGAERLKGYRRDEIVGRHFSTFYTQEDREEGLPGALLAVASREGSVRHSGWRVRKDGSRFWGDVTITAMREDDELIGFAKITRDLTAAHESERALRRSVEREREAAAELEQLSELRRQFLAGVAHDLSNPIAVIRTAAGLLEDDAAGRTAEEQELIVRIRRRARDLAAFAHQLHEFARLDAGRVELSTRPVDLADVAAELAVELASTLDDVDIRSEVEPGIRVEADALALRRILANLVTNAARFSPPDAPVLIRSRPGPETVAVGVSDEGPGIPREEQEHLFEMFWQGAETGRSRGRGLGLGLWVVHRYVELHDGEAWVDSEPGDGTTCWFTLPRSPDGAG